MRLMTGNAVKRSILAPRVHHALLRRRMPRDRMVVLQSGVMAGKAQFLRRLLELTGQAAYVWVVAGHTLPDRERRVNHRLLAEPAKIGMTDKAGFFRSLFKRCRTVLSGGIVAHLA